MNKTIIALTSVLLLALSTNSFAQENNVIPSILIVGVDNPGMNNRLHYLPGVKAEVDSILAITKGWEQKCLTGQDATIDNLIICLKDTPNILQISGHGFRINNDEDLIMPLYSEEPLFFGDDRNNINKNAIFDVDKIKDYAPTGIDLIVLSTNHSYSPTVIEALKEAKVKSCLLSAWDVSDEATQILMTNFYKNYLGGMSKQQSLREAQKAVRETPGFSDPEFWAAFILLDALN